jgi:hypothetical protein
MPDDRIRWRRVSGPFPGKGRALNNGILFLGSLFVRDEMNLNLCSSNAVLPGGQNMA